MMAGDRKLVCTREGRFRPDSAGGDASGGGGGVLRMHRIVLTLVTAVVLALGMQPALSASPAGGATGGALPAGGRSGGLPLGPSTLPQHQTETQVAPGVS